MYTRENSRPLVECSVRRLTRSGATSIPSDVESATRSNRRSILSLSVPPLHVVERGSGGEAHVVERGSGGEAGSAGEGSSISARSRATAGPLPRDSAALDRARPGGAS